MPFKKGENKYQLEGVKAKREMKERRNDIVVKAITGGFYDYQEKLERLKNGEELTKPEIDYMDRIEKWVGRAIPNLSSTDLTTNGKEMSMFGLGHKELEERKK